jgi:hypothetical protein
VKRRLFNVLSAVALLLLASVVALWVRSYFKADFVGYKAGSGERRLYGVISSRGVVWLGWRQMTETGEPEFYRRSSPAREWRLADSHWWSFRFDSSGAGLGVERAATLPHWALALPLAVAPIVSLVRWKRRRHKHGLCAVCGYDLRATPERCPECGNARASAPVQIPPGSTP